MTLDHDPKNILTNQFDYILLKDALHEYKHPRVKINQMLRQHDILRVKKGIYIKTGASYDPCVLANMIYGPSYVSQDYALSLYGLIPERVTTVTSMTTGRNKRFDTPVGVFTYEHLDANLYSHGLRRVALEKDKNNDCAYIIATPEKALIDRIWKIKNITTPKALEEYLEDDMRLDLSDQKTIKLTRLRELAKIYRRPIVTLLEKVLTSRIKR